MPGYNHFPWCVCGWCYKQGAGGYSPGRVTDYLRKRDAERRLREADATRSWTACFVVPNAKCPVCGESVWYYENRHGSRVYFDALGRPWPKHKCTDSSHLKLRPTVLCPIERRPRGAVQEILEDAVAAGFDPNGAFRSEYGYSPWDLLEVVETFRVGHDNYVAAESLSPPVEEKVYLSFTSGRIVPVVGDLFSLDDARESIAVFDFDCLEVQRFNVAVLGQDNYESARPKLS